MEKSATNMDTLYIYAEMNINHHTEMQLKFPGSQIPLS